MKTMSYPFNCKWKVQINAGLFMAGIHRFKTKKAAKAFIDDWWRTPGNVPNDKLGKMTYADLPAVEKAEAKE